MSDLSLNDLRLGQAGLCDLLHVMVQEKFSIKDIEHLENSIGLLEKYISWKELIEVSEPVETSYERAMKGIK